MDPTSLIATALAAGAVAALKATAPTVIKDAYAGLKRILRDRYAAAQDSVEQLEDSPESQGRRAVVAEELATAGAASDPDILDQAEALIDLLRTHDPDAARTVALDLAGFKASELEAEDISAESGTGSATAVRMSEAEIEGKASFKNLKARGGADHPKAQES
jgi:hypothetical protein